MAFDVVAANATVRSTSSDAVPDPRRGSPEGDRPISVTRRVPDAVRRHLLRAAVAMQAEELLRTVGAFAGAGVPELDGMDWMARDAEDLALLAGAAVRGGAELPAGLDNGMAEDDHTVLESLLAGREALLVVLRELADIAMNAAPDGGRESWHRVVQEMLDRREQEVQMLKGLGAGGLLPTEPEYQRGAFPGRHFRVDLIS